MGAVEISHVLFFLFTAALSCLRRREWLRKTSANTTDYRQQAVKLTYTESTARALLTPDFCGRLGFADYQMSNNRAEIKRLEKRIRQLEQLAETETTEQDTGFCRVVENAEENRMQLVFDGKPDTAIRAILKRHAFRWSPRNGAWQRQLTNAGRYGPHRKVST